VISGREEVHSSFLMVIWKGFLSRGKILILKNVKKEGIKE